MTETPERPDQIAEGEAAEVPTTAVEAADLADEYDQMLRLADLFDASGDDLRSRARLGADILRDDDVAASADLSPPPTARPRRRSGPPRPASTA